MKKINFKRIGMCLIIILASFAVDAHQPVLNNENGKRKEQPYIIDEVEVSKAIYAELKGQPHYYQISSNKQFNFYL